MLREVIKYSSGDKDPKGFRLTLEWRTCKVFAFRGDDRKCIRDISLSVVTPVEAGADRKEKNWRR